MEKVKLKKRDSELLLRDLFLDIIYDGFFPLLYIYISLNMMATSSNLEFFLHVFVASLIFEEDMDISFH